jgi:hypothetical protein
LRSASGVFIKNVCAGTYFPLSVFKGMNTVAAPLPYNYIEYHGEKVCRKKIVFCFEPQLKIHTLIQNILLI